MIEIARSVPRQLSGVMEQGCTHVPAVIRRAVTRILERLARGL
jgi:hypothetical protein